jgi:hypothetical protein
MARIGIAVPESCQSSITTHFPRQEQSVSRRDRRFFTSVSADERDARKPVGALALALIALSAMPVASQVTSMRQSLTCRACRMDIRILQGVYDLATMTPLRVHLQIVWRRRVHPLRQDARRRTGKGIAGPTIRLKSACSSGLPWIGTGWATSSFSR